jgi:hypothetical protein
VPEALKEWLFTETVVDHEKPVATCELCSKEGLRYQFEIRNQHNQNLLLVGSECIQRFGISVYEDGIRLDRRGARRKLNNLMRKMRYDSSMKALECVAEKESANAILYNALKYYREHGYLTPKFAFVVFWKLKKHKIDHIPQFFKVRLKRNKDKADLRAMPKSHVHMLWPALSRDQRRLAVSFGHCGAG